VVLTIVGLRKSWRPLQAEIKRTVHGNGMSPEDAQALARMMAAFINKMLHDPTVFLKREGMHGDKALYIDTVRKLFKLDE
jgi:glutamyl-tRNA reductase